MRLFAAITAFVSLLATIGASGQTPPPYSVRPERISGNSIQFNQRGVYGVQGQPAARNVPGSRQYSTIVFNDSADGSLILFGGVGYAGMLGITGARATCVRSG